MGFPARLTFSANDARDRNSHIAQLMAQFSMCVFSEKLHVFAPPVVHHKTIIFLNGNTGLLSLFPPHRRLEYIR